MGLINHEVNVSTSRTMNWIPDPANGLGVNCVQGSNASGTTTYAAITQFWGSGTPLKLYQGANACPVSGGAAVSGYLVQTSAHDARQRPTSLTLASSTLATLESLSYTWDLNGNLNSETIMNDVNTPVTITQNFVAPAPYDGVNRLISVAESSGATTGWSQSFGYDPFGNRTLLTSSNTLPYAAVTPNLPQPASNVFTLGQNFPPPNQTTITGLYSNNQISGVTYDPGVRWTPKPGQFLALALSGSAGSHGGGGEAAIHSGPGTALGSHPCVALSSSQAV